MGVMIAVRVGRRVDMGRISLRVGMRRRIVILMAGTMLRRGIKIRQSQAEIQETGIEHQVAAKIPEIRGRTKVDIKITKIIKIAKIETLEIQIAGTIRANNMTRKVETTYPKTTGTTETNNPHSKTNQTTNSPLEVKAGVRQLVGIIASNSSGVDEGLTIHQVGTGVLQTLGGIRRVKGQVRIEGKISHKVAIIRIGVIKEGNRNIIKDKVKVKTRTKTTTDRKTINTTKITETNQEDAMDPTTTETVATHHITETKTNVQSLNTRQWDRSLGIDLTKTFRRQGHRSSNQRKISPQGNSTNLIYLPITKMGLKGTKGIVIKRQTVKT